MKRVLTVVCAACLLLLAACGRTGGGASGGSAGAPVEVEHIDSDGALDAACVEYELGRFSFEIPADWTAVDGTGMGLVNGVYFLPPGTDEEDFQFSAHVAVETSDESVYTGGGTPDFTDADMQESFFGYQLASTYSNMGGLSDLEFAVWEVPGGEVVYIEQFLRSNDTLTMYQTTYHVMNTGWGMDVNASYFGEDASPEVNAVARHLIATLSVA